MTKYQQLLSQPDSEKKEQEIVFQVRKAKAKLEADILATEERLAARQEELARQKANYPLDPHAVVTLTDEVEALQRGIKKLTELKDELFSDPEQDLPFR
jgi:hypothetical protein